LSSHDLAFYASLYVAKNIDELGKKTDKVIETTDATLEGVKTLSEGMKKVEKLSDLHAAALIQQTASVEALEEKFDAFIARFPDTPPTSSGNIPAQPGPSAQRRQDSSLGPRPPPRIPLADRGNTQPAANGGPRSTVYKPPAEVSVASSGSVSTMSSSDSIASAPSRAEIALKRDLERKKRARGKGNDNNKRPIAKVRRFR